ncbi:MAG TPA: flippase activity-associated protein Agl23 [Pyrinomonadaceae bacterium]|nr:flippase activity-associated protein Agl23 [Pyrinomonadaceae bacterium]
MGTSSTKRNRKRSQDSWGATTSSAAKGKGAGAGKRQTPAENRRAPVAPARTVGDEIPDRAWLVASIVILMLATALRVYALDLNPLHHDEGVNGFFLTNLLRQHVYHYDPQNYHGPTLYYLTLPVVAIFGLSTFAVRFITAAFGIATVWLVLALRRHIGSVAALTAAALVAVSPACVFYSRYFIHESLFVFFTLGIVVAALRFYESGEAIYLVLATASAAMLFATKETAFISVVTLGLAWLVAHVWVSVTGGSRRRGGEAEGESGLAMFFSSGQSPLVIGGAVVLFVFIWVIFYSSFFTNWKGVADSFEAFDLWGKTGMSEFHKKPFGTYVEWLWQEEAPILILACVGAFVALFERKKNRFAVFTSAWAFGLLVAYSLISYKTPWLVLSFVVPLAIAGGYAVQALDRLGPAGLKGRVPAIAVAAVALAVCTYQTVVLNFREYDNDRYPYVYSHTVRQALDLVREIDQLGARANTKEPGVTVASPDYWPLPWYFRDNSHVGFVGNVSTFYDPKSTLAVVGKEDQLPQLQRALGDAYTRVGGIYPLRPGVNLVLFERRDLAPTH